ncbi:cellobiose phosphorylase [Gracilibacillus alcaliphilus]|uniref:cellobiose phosphorylase n=1 Tax=Gracilibacillus alcaliphilus TaxID=1401441 RepID=UPI00195B596E|nr:cellobiose phosphorylase [Gracilibacillus alcaliphilus]MBM7675245.1 cellobiose phosphorylase [Gracilibacillus alcaliphilus]
MIKEKTDLVKLGTEELSFSFLNSGDLYEIGAGHLMLNQLLTNPIDGSLNNLYLRIHHQDKIDAFPLLGIEPNHTIQYGSHAMRWTGTVQDISYQVTFILTDKKVWFWDVQLEGNHQIVDVIYGQDIGLADKSAIRNNEAYVSQYLDHCVIEDEQYGYVICTRQNQPQASGFPYLQQGALTKAVGYSTDGFQFFGKEYKASNQPIILEQPALANQVYQYEFAYAALQTEKIQLDGQAQSVFYGLFEENHEAAVTEVEFHGRLQAAWQQVKHQPIDVPYQMKKISKQPNIGQPLETISLTEDEVRQRFPKRHQEERDKGELLSFFTDTYEHVVLKEKELLIERPHGHILMSGNNHQLKKDTMSTTSWMYGVFNAQLVIGNTSFNKLLSNTRNALNIQKTSGQRIYVEINGEYRLLTLPSAFEMGINYARWYYKTADDMFIITNYSSVEQAEITLTAETVSQSSYRYLITHQFVMHGNEYEVPYHTIHNGRQLTVTADRLAQNADVYPQLTYRLQLVGADYQLADQSLFVDDESGENEYINIHQLTETSQWKLTIQGSLDGEEQALQAADWQTETENYRKYYQEVMNHFYVTTDQGPTEELQKMNAIAWWYTHNMLVHFSSPHGLEQYSGAAWGTRDVCQGPTEYFLATQQYTTVKDIIKTVYQHQFLEDGNWPQWFMFDQYFSIQAEESHGDIIIWPLKVVADYLFITEDFSILEEQIPYTVREQEFSLTEEHVTLWEHIEKQMAYIKQHFLHQSYLSSYGDGDWDDTLQPANANLKKFMSSSWTVALTYQTLDRLAVILAVTDKDKAKQIQQLANGVEKDYRKYIMSDAVIPGFIYMEQAGQAEYMLHPTDQKTGIDYRLLPMQRSIISELFSLEEANFHYQIIKQHLSHPDGVRLMNRPASYKGGISKQFKRAEQAANFGREIGLQYVHAHIRYVEAMAKLGKEAEVWQGLQVINPIQIQSYVANAERRQSNAYFSSSDGKFNDRYQAQEQFDRLREGTVPVKGGWRIYSSGPGIYMNQLISHALGIRTERNDLVIDPVLEERLDGLVFQYKWDGKRIAFVYHIGKGEQKIMINNQPFTEFTRTANRYREGGFVLPNQLLKEFLTKENNCIEVFL